MKKTVPKEAIVTIPKVTLLLEATPWFAREEALYLYIERVGIHEIQGRAPKALAEQMAFEEVKAHKWT